MIKPAELISSDILIERILNETSTIAMVGASPTATRDSYRVMQYLQGAGYRVIPINPLVAGIQILGETAYASLSDIPDQFEMVDIFRASSAVPGIVEEALTLTREKGISAIWMQLGVISEEDSSEAKLMGLNVIMDRCVKIEHARLCQESDCRAINTGNIPSKI